jgi:hypothetical protein
MPADARGLLSGTALRVPEKTRGVVLKTCKKQKRNTPLT